jgi:hypothetical protein
MPLARSVTVTAITAALLSVSVVAPAAAQQAAGTRIDAIATRPSGRSRYRGW